MIGACPGPVWDALSTAADRIATAEYRAGRYRPRRDRRGRVVQGYTITDAHRAVLDAQQACARGEITPDTAMSVLHTYDVLKARTRADR